jgi:hypothetical protein
MACTKKYAVALFVTGTSLRAAVSVREFVGCDTLKNSATEDH